MARYTVSADSVGELIEALNELTGGAEGASEGNAATATASKGRGRPRKSTAPDPVNPTGPAPTEAAPTAAGFNPTAGAAPAADAGPTGVSFNPGASAGGGVPFNPGVAQAPAESPQLQKTRSHLDEMAKQHGAANVFNWVKQILGTAVDANATPEAVRDTVLPSLNDAQLLEIYQKAGGK